MQRGISLDRVEMAENNRGMNTLKTTVATIAAALLAALLIAPAYAEEQEATESTAAPDMHDPAMMAKMMEMAKPGEQHKMLADLAGTWDYTVKM